MGIPARVRPFPLEEFVSTLASFSGGFFFSPGEFVCWHDRGDKDGGLRRRGKREEWAEGGGKKGFRKKQGCLVVF